MRLVLGLTAGWVMSSCIAAWAAASGPQGDSWSSIAQLPDWTGTWEPSPPFAAVDRFNVALPLKLPAQKLYDELGKLQRAGGDVPSRTYHCVTRGFPGAMAGPETFLEFAYSPGRVLITDTSGWVRRIYTDGRGHSDGIDTFQGDSIGHWEMGTLVVDTTSLDAGNEFIYGVAQGENSRGQERMALAGADTLRIDTIFDAPGIMTAPYSFSKDYARHRDWMTGEFDCQQNNRDVDPVTGRQKFDLTAPP